MVPNIPITIDDLLELGFMVKEYDDNYKCCTVNWHLGYQRGFMSKGYANGLALFNQNRKEIAERLAIDNIKKDLGKWIDEMSDGDRKEVSKLQKLKVGALQDKIEIEKYVDDKRSKYIAEFYVRGMSHYVETFVATVTQEGEHFILNYEQIQHDYSSSLVHQDVRHSYKMREVYHDKTKAVEVGLEKIKKDVPQSMAYHDMPEYKDLKFEIVERK